jgi:hypothetical protein
MNAVAPLQLPSLSRKRREVIESRYAALIDSLQMTGGETAPYFTLTLRGAHKHGLIQSPHAPVRPTAYGLAWRAQYRGAVAMRTEIVASSPQNRARPADYVRPSRAKPPELRKTRIAKPKPVKTPKPTVKPKPTPKPSTVARDLMAAGLVFVHPKLIDDLSTEELALWIKAKRHERDGLTLAALAALLGEPLAHVRIRAERIVAKGYVVAVRTEDAA